MAINKSELYSSLWQSCDELRGGMDASQYKDHVLVRPRSSLHEVRERKIRGRNLRADHDSEGARFSNMVALKSHPEIGDRINKKIVAPLTNANKLSDFPDFDDATKLGSGKEMVERLTKPLRKIPRCASHTRLLRSDVRFEY